MGGKRDDDSDIHTGQREIDLNAGKITLTLKEGSSIDPSSLSFLLV